MLWWPMDVKFSVSCGSVRSHLWHMYTRHIFSRVSITYTDGKTPWLLVAQNSISFTNDQQHNIMYLLISAPNEDSHQPAHPRSITKTCLYNFDSIKPHFDIVKLGFTRVYSILSNWGCSNEYPQFMYWAKIWKISEFFIWKFSVFGGEIFYIFE